MELVLVRHAQASFGTSDYDRLSPLGLQQSDWLGSYFEQNGLVFDRVFRGALRRHRETVDGIASRHALGEATIDERLNEFHYDGLEKQYLIQTGGDSPTNRGQFLEIFPKMFTLWENEKISGAGETYLEFQQRVDEAVEAALTSGETVLMVTSGGVISCVLRKALGLSASVTAEMLVNIHNASVHRFIWEYGKLRLSVFNASPHFDAKERVHARTYI